MTASIVGFGLLGIEGIPVEVQVGHQDGLPGIDIAGLPSASIREARHRVRSALRASGYGWPRERLVANFAPADFPKVGTSYDLPLAVAILTLEKLLPCRPTSEAAFFGELTLDGRVRPVPGAVNAALAARTSGRRVLYVATESAAEAASVPEVSVRGVESLVALVEALHGRAPIEPAAPAPDEEAGRGCGIDLAVVRGQYRARRALEVAAAGGHNLMLVGPPGCGKTLVARAMPGILPPMELDERLEVTRIHSVSGLVGPHGGLIARRPFRAPHATASYAALVGGGNPPRPGEVSLAHRGVLFLDEVPEFNRLALESLRAPLEDRVVAISRAARRVVFPASFALVCAMNPCMCGHLDDPLHPCRCTPRQVDSYRGRLSGPLLDRIDIHVEMSPVPPSTLAAAPHGEPTATVRERVVAARRVQRERSRATGVCATNAELGPAELERVAALGREERAHLVRVAEALGLTARSWNRVIKVARTIADLAGAGRVGVSHLSEALTYRALDFRRETGVAAAEVAPEIGS